jgi:hypothetical protein
VYWLSIIGIVCWHGRLPPQSVVRGLAGASDIGSPVFNWLATRQSPGHFLVARQLANQVKTTSIAKVANDGFVPIVVLASLIFVATNGLERLDYG